jgi:hypothetical protein
MANKIINKPEPSWRDQLYTYGFNDKDIDEINAVPQHRFFIKMNMTFSESLKKDIKDNIEVKFCADIKEHYDNIMKGIGRVETNVSNLKIEVEGLKTGQKDMQKDITILKKRNSIKSYIIRGTIYIAIALVIEFVALMFLFPWYHAHFADFFKKKNSHNIELIIERDNRILNASTRGIKKQNYANYKKEQIDSISNKNINDKEYVILSTIQENNNMYEKKYGHKLMSR